MQPDSCLHNERFSVYSVTTFAEKARPRQCPGEAAIFSALIGYAIGYGVPVMRPASARRESSRTPSERLRRRR